MESLPAYITLSSPAHFSLSHQSYPFPSLAVIALVTLIIIIVVIVMVVVAVAAVIVITIRILLVSAWEAVCLII